MKRLVVIIVCLLTIHIGYAQTIIDPLYIFRNDGQFNSFIRSKVDSISFSHYDADGILHDRMTTQVVYTPDSIFHIPVEAVDSILFFTDRSVGWSDSSKIIIPKQPRCAYINITGISAMPVKKNTNAHAWMEVWDGQGHYFKKRVIVDLNGDSSSKHEKKNFAVDFCEDEWIGDETTSIKIGEWVKQDGFHFKANHTSITKGECPVSYKLYDKFMETKPYYRRAPYMEYYTIEEIDSLIQKNDKDILARCWPDGFPCIVYLNGEYYGIYSWQLKKHRDNYNLGRNKTDNIHLEGYLGGNEIWKGNISWSRFEVRNPKPKKDKWTLLCQDGSVYDGDSPKELMGTDSPAYDETDESCRKSAEVKAHIVALSHYMSEIAVFETAYKNEEISLEELKAEIEKRFSIEWIIDYVIFINVTGNSDSTQKNWQWVTWGDIDGQMKWYPNPYDFNSSFGVTATTGFANKEPRKEFIGLTGQTPARYVFLYFFDVLKARYAELRRANVISHNTIYGLFQDWTDRAGAENYQREAERWPNMPCNRDSWISDNWELTGSVFRTFQGKKSSWSTSSTYSAGSYCKYKFRCYVSLKSGNKGNKPDAENSEWWQDVSVKAGTYKAGDLVFDGRSNFYEFRALKDIEVTQDNSNADRPDHLVGTPFGKFYPVYPYEGGTHDSLERINDWIQKEIAILDEMMGYKIEN